MSFEDELYIRSEASAQQILSSFLHREDQKKGKLPSIHKMPAYFYASLDYYRLTICRSGEFNREFIEEMYGYNISFNFVLQFEYKDEYLTDGQQQALRRVAYALNTFKGDITMEVHQRLALVKIGDNVTLKKWIWTSELRSLVKVPHTVE